MAQLSKIKEIAKRQGVTLGSLANQINITEQALFRLIRENSTKIDTLEKIAKVLNCSITEFFDDCKGVVMATNTGNDVIAATPAQALDEIARQRQLTEKAQELTAEAQRQSAELIIIVKNLTQK